jgi:hypothetical protein
MSSMTADLEYFKCDLCGTFFHRDIFCPHRRACKGLDSQELTAAQAAGLGVGIDKLARKEDSCGASSAAACRIMGAGGGAAERPGVPLQRLEEIKRDSVRTRTANAYAAELAAEEAARADGEKAKLDALMADLMS